jgi:ureidoacrylate peracid hydrolase
MHKVNLDPAIANRRPLDFSDLDARKTALLVIDMQTFFIDWPDGMANPHAVDIIDNINRLSAALRAAGGQVIFTRHAVRDDAPYRPPAWQEKGSAALKALNARLRPGNPEFEVHPRIETGPGDGYMTKHRPSAFHPLTVADKAQALKPRLAEAGIDTLIITGTLTNGWCESTARDAWQHNFKLLFPSDANATITDAEHNATLLSMSGMFAHVLTTDQAVGILQRQRLAAA